MSPSPLASDSHEIIMVSVVALTARELYKVMVGVSTCSVFWAAPKILILENFLKNVMNFIRVFQAVNGLSKQKTCLSKLIAVNGIRNSFFLLFRGEFYGV